MKERPSVLHFLERNGMDPDAELELEELLDPQRVAEVRRLRGQEEKRVHNKEKIFRKAHKR